MFGGSLQNPPQKIMNGVDTMTNLTKELTQDLITQKVNKLDFDEPNIKGQIVDLMLDNITSMDQFILVKRLQNAIDDLIKANTQAYTQLHEFDKAFMSVSKYNNETEVQEIKADSWSNLKARIQGLKSTLAQTNK